MTVKSLTLACLGLKQHVVMGALLLPVVTCLTPARSPAPPQSPSLLPTPPVPPARLHEAHIYSLVLRSQDVKATCLFPAQHYLFPSLGICSHGDSAKTPSWPSPVYIIPFLKTRLRLTIHSYPISPSLRTLGHVPYHQISRIFWGLKHTLANVSHMPGV